MSITTTKLVSNPATLSALTVLTSMAVRGVRKVDATLRIKMAVRTIGPEATPEALAAVWALVKLGHQVRVFEGGVIYTASLSSDGAQVWGRRSARVERCGAVVEVSL